MRRDAGYWLLLSAIPALVLVHLFVAPYTKVEESFHIQAIHDIETYGIPFRNISDAFWAQYDHFTFPGAVPRTFVGAVILSGASSPFLWLNDNINRQVLARAILGLFNALSLLSFADGFRRTAGATAATWYLLLQASQFHVLYYASRTLSNMFAFGISTLALRALLPEPVSPRVYRKRSQAALFLLTTAGIIFRAELALFLGIQTIFLFATRRVSLYDIAFAGIVGLFVGLSLTVSLDSFLWQQFPVWPELTAFKFNVLAGQASAWGTHPWHFYLTNAIPRLLLNPLMSVVGIPLALIHPATRGKAVPMALPSLFYVLAYSAQPHKEWRFIVYIVPALTAVSALGASHIWIRRTKSLLYRLLSLLLIMSTIFSFLISSFVLLPASSANYPGAEAIHAVHRHARTGNTQHPQVRSVYLGNLACQTGITRFLEIPGIKYDKTEDETLKSSPSFWNQFDYVLVEPGKEAVNVREISGDPWVDVETINGFAGLRILRPNDEAIGAVEERVLRRVFGSSIISFWNRGRNFARQTFTRGWWVELRMEPKIQIMQRAGQSI